LDLLSFSYWKSQFMRVTLIQLESFFWVAKLGSTKAAARQLNLAQPTISLRLRDLETALGIKLFERLGRGMRLSNDGSELLERAENVLAEMTRLSELSNVRNPLRAIIRLGVPETFALVCLPSLMLRLQQEHKLLRLEIVVATSAHLEALLLDRQLDVAFIVNPTSDPRLRLLPLGTQETTWLAAPRFGLTPPIRPQDLHNLPIISNPHPSPMHHQIIDWFRSTGLEVPRLSFCNSLTVIAHLIERGIFVGFLPLKLVQAQIENGSIHALSSRPPAIRARIYGCYRLAEGGPAINAILNTARSVVDEVDFLEAI
jgi:DNA-binding transcriptional LysR family regulator